MDSRQQELPWAIRAYQSSGDADAFAKALQAGGYAGHHNLVYADALTSMMKAHNFYQYNAVAKGRAAARTGGAAR